MSNEIRIFKDLHELLSSIDDPEKQRATKEYFRKVGAFENNELATIYLSQYNFMAEALALVDEFRKENKELKQSFDAFKDEMAVLKNDYESVINRGCSDMQTKIDGANKNFAENTNNLINTANCHADNISAFSETFIAQATTILKDQTIERGMEIKAIGETVRTEIEKETQNFLVKFLGEYMPNVLKESVKEPLNGFLVKYGNNLVVAANKIKTHQPIEPKKLVGLMSAVGFGSSIITIITLKFMHFF